MDYLIENDLIIGYTMVYANGKVKSLIYVIENKAKLFTSIYKYAESKFPDVFSKYFQLICSSVSGKTKITKITLAERKKKYCIPY